MPRVSKRARHLKKAREIQAQKLNARKNEPIPSKKDRERINLISAVQQLPDEEVPTANYLIATMRYPKGLNEGKLLSPYLQNKAHEYVSQSLYKHQTSVTSLQEANNRMITKIKQLQRQNDHLVRRTQSLGAYVQHFRDQKSKHISEIRSLVSQSQKISDTAFKKKIKSIFKKNEREYTSNTVWLATSISQIGQLSMHSTVECTKLIYEYLIGEAPHNWLSTSTLRTWHQDVSNIHVSSQISQIECAPAFGVMVDESTRGEIKNFVICYQFWNEQKQAPIATIAHLKNIPRCNSDTVSNIVIESIQKDGLDVMKCILWTTDNTAYMSSGKKGAIVLFNEKTGANTFRIGCGLHIMQIVLNHFEQEAFGLLANTTGFSRNPHPYNLLYLAWNLHDGYNSSNKDKPLNINAKIIKDLYDKLIGFHYNQYQLPLRSCWGYELQTAKQYLDRHEAHIYFTHWFITQLEKHNKTPKSYLKDWYLFKSWLLNPLLNIQIKCLVNFAEHFYEPLIQFMVGQDPIPRIIQNGRLVQLPPGRRAHEMPEKVYEWSEFLINLRDNFEMFFADELLEALDTLSSNEFGQLFDDLERGISEAHEYFKKWMDSWLHLPLAICQLGGDNSQSFANSFRYIILKKSWIKPPTELEMKFAKDLENDINNGNTSDFGLHKLLLHNTKFHEEFENFCKIDNPILYEFPELYNFVKSHIYFIIVHQQQVEGLFNKLDLKTHHNMSQSLKQSKLRLASDKIEKEDLAFGLEKYGLKERKKMIIHYKIFSQRNLEKK